MAKKTDQFADFEDLAARASQRRGGCAAGKLLTLLESESAIAELGGELAPPLRRAMANGALTANGIRTTLEAKLDPSWDVPSVVTLQRHRKGECGCERGGA